MIDGKILFTKHREAEWLQQGLAYDSIERMQPNAEPNGWSIIQDAIYTHCSIWNLSKADQQKILIHMRSLYLESREFLNLDKPKPTGP